MNIARLLVEEEITSFYRIQNIKTKLFWQSGAFTSKKGKLYRLSDAMNIINQMSKRVKENVKVSRYEVTKIEECFAKDARDRYKMGKDVKIK